MAVSRDPSHSTRNSPRQDAGCSSSGRSSLKTLELFTHYQGYIESDDDTNPRYQVTSILEDYYRFKHMKAGMHHNKNASPPSNDLTSSNESDEYFTAREFMTCQSQKKTGRTVRQERFYARINRRMEQRPTIIYSPPLRVPHQMFENGPGYSSHPGKFRRTELADPHRIARAPPLPQSRIIHESPESHNEVESLCNDRRENGFAYITHGKGERREDKESKSVPVTVCPLCLSPYRGKSNLYEKLEMWKKDYTSIDQNQKSYTSVNDYPQVIHSDTAKDMNMNVDVSGFDGFSAFVRDKIDGPFGNEPPKLHLNSDINCRPLKVMNPSKEEEKALIPVKKKSPDTTEGKRYFEPWDNSVPLSHYKALLRKDYSKVEEIRPEEENQMPSQVCTGDSTTKSPSISEKRSSSAKSVQRCIGKNKAWKFLEFLFCGKSCYSGNSNSPLSSQDLVIQQLKELGSEINELERASKRKKIKDDDEHVTSRMERESIKCKIRPLSDSIALLGKRSPCQSDLLRPLSSSRLEGKKIDRESANNILQVLRRSRIPVRSNATTIHTGTERKNNSAPSTNTEGVTTALKSQRGGAEGAHQGDAESRRPYRIPKHRDNEKVPPTGPVGMSGTTRFARRANKYEKIPELQAHGLTRRRLHRPLPPSPARHASGGDRIQIPGNSGYRRPLLEQAYINRSYRIMTELKRNTRKISTEQLATGSTTTRTRRETPAGKPIQDIGKTVPLSAQNLAQHNNNQTPHTYMPLAPSTSTSDFVMNRVSNIAQAPPERGIDRLKGILTGNLHHPSPTQSS